MFDLKVPNLNERERIPMEAIQAVAEHIARRFQPDRIILFGSYAYGEPKPWSDVDLLVVMETPLTHNRQRREISRALAPKPFAMDIVIRSSRELRERIPDGDWFLKEIVEKGKILYERPR